MNMLHLSGYGVKLRVRNLKSRSEMEVTNGRDFNKGYSTYMFRPRRFPYSSVVIDGHSGYISLQALHWLSRNKIPVFIMNFDGSVISSILPPMPVKADLRVAQFQAASDPKKKFAIARALVQAKITRSLQVLGWLGQRYDISKEVRVARLESSKLRRARTVSDIRVVEGRVARRYWETFGKVLPEHLDFQGRMTSSHQNNASDPVNLALNYGYGFLEGEVRKAINSVGLEPSVGFLHDFSDYQTKQSLVYDLQEPFRWISDISAIEAFESEALKLSDFYFTGDDYRYRFEPEAKQRFIDLIRQQFNCGARYKARVLKWDTVVPMSSRHRG
jgi:CRISPR-associated protein Cas1